MKTRNILHYLKRIRTAINANNKSEAEERVSRLMRMLKKDLKSKSENVRAAIVHKSGKSYNQDGKKWGRPKAITKQIRQMVISMHESGDSYNTISKNITYTNNKNQVKHISKAMICKIITGKTYG